MDHFDAVRSTVNNPFLVERPRAPDPVNPFAPPATDEQRQRALEWLRSDDA